jgi:hypothetical protein
MEMGLIEERSKYTTGLMKYRRQNSSVENTKPFAN